MKKAGEILCAHFPWAMCLNGDEHVLSLFFSDLSRLGAIKVIFLFNYMLHLQNSHFLEATCLESMQTLQHIWKWCQSFHAQFMAQASIFNDGHKIELLCGAGTRFATWFYAMHWLLRLKRALKDNSWCCI